MIDKEKKLLLTMIELQKKEIEFLELLINKLMISVENELKTKK